MTQLFVVRHGETEWSRSGQHTSVTDLPLTRNGEREARKLADRLNPADFSLVLSSPRQRARHTAELAGFTGSSAPQLEEDLAEWSYGDFEGRTSEQIQESVPEWTIWTHLTPGGETAAQIGTRLDRVIRRVHDSGVDRAICFAHGHILRALTVRWLELDLSLGGHFPLDTGTISILGEVKGIPALQQWNA
ncbi:MAG: Fructose-1,6-bisphosphatase, Mycobacterial type SUP1; Sugar phosphatase SUP1 [uncultured Propionibacteriaceae bacterium]|uniref:Fructose-1,6-bisphosphatase, Mycobacterial type SUP1 Sugar phosphatase SUP1 n=1 Tax=uncultured Propionibacteriaceae bacterium TaxID=257457 RepID=A0A6J4N0J6_9ACTN|nr:MAG: Fructose-1,6-bisphosphatase, Mycobacterial type SUP1; Sugar phosphatase SUP1 [uncultured Propionibacteriaceae bacterium]